MPSPRAAALFLLTCAAGVALSAPPAEARTEYHCVVQDFIGFSDDTAFKAKNRRKTFTLVVGSNTITTRVKSREFRDHENTYRITKRGLLDTFAITDRTSSLDTLAMPSNPRNMLNRQGYFNATVATQANHYLNTWLLRCSS